MNGKNRKDDKKRAKGAPALAAVAPARADKPAKTIDSAIDLETVRELARIIGEFGLSEVEADPSGHVRVRRDLGGGGAASAAAVGAAPIALAPSPPVEGAADAGTFITSPFVGTFYRAPSPD